MNIQAEKLQLIEQILQVSDESLIDKMKTVLRVEPKTHYTGISLLRGKLKPQTNDEIDRDLKALRDEWERDF